ncbi:carbohydrate ABC transporter permease, partial [Frankia sp. AgB1.8]|nr:carbohydrate ABC transporter permease [Frankia sp. AgB1.8]
MSVATQEPVGASVPPTGPPGPVARGARRRRNAAPRARRPGRLRYPVLIVILLISVFPGYWTF